MPGDTDRQNWESGIAWTVRSCTFFRNYMGFSSAILTADVWPHDYVFEDTHFIQNAAATFFCQDEVHMFHGYPGEDRRRGSSWMSHTNTLYDGGFVSEGLLGIMPADYMIFDPDDDPDLVVNITHNGTTHTDHGNVLWGIGHAPAAIWPPQSDQLRKINLHMVDYRMTGNLAALASGDTYDSSTIADFGVNTLMERTRILDNGNANSGAQGVGGITLFRGESQLPENRATARFVNTEWAGNMAGNGAAVGLLSGLIDLSFDNCIMRNNVAHLGGGAISFDVSAAALLPGCSKV